MPKTKLTLTQWGVMFLIGCVFALEFAMLVQSMFGVRVIPQVIGFFIPFAT